MSRQFSPSSKALRLRRRVSSPQARKVRRSALLTAPRRWLCAWPRTFPQRRAATRSEDTPRTTATNRAAHASVVPSFAHCRNILQSGGLRASPKRTKTKRHNPQVYKALPAVVFTIAGALTSNYSYSPISCKDSFYNGFEGNNHHNSGIISG